MDKIFPEMSGLIDGLSNEQKKKLIDKFSNKIIGVSVYLEDFRNEIQNITVGKVLKKSIPRRMPDQGYRVLTPKGFIIQKEQLLTKFNILNWFKWIVT